MNYNKTKTKGKNMNTKVDELIKSLAQSVTHRGTRKKLTLGLAGMTLVAGTLFVTGFGQNNYRLGGAFVGGNSMYTWSVLFAPSDAAGQTAAARPILRQFNNQFAGLLAAFGADNLSDATGEVKMVSPDTADWTLISNMQVTPKQLGDVLQTKAIIVSHGKWKFTSQDTAVLDYVLDIYLPSADADGDGYPDAGVPPFLSVPTQDSAKRVPIL